MTRAQIGRALGRLGAVLNMATLTATVLYAELAAAAVESLAPWKHTLFSRRALVPLLALWFHAVAAFA